MCIHLDHLKWVDLTDEKHDVVIVVSGEVKKQSRLEVVESVIDPPVYQWTFVNHQPTRFGTLVHGLKHSTGKKYMFGGPVVYGDIDKVVSHQILIQIVSYTFFGTV